MAKIIVTNFPSIWHQDDVLVDGKFVEKTGVIEATYIKFCMPCRARCSSEAAATFKLTGQLYILLYESYNARASPIIKKTENCEEIWSYGDGHGKRWAALLKVLDPTKPWQVDYNVPGHHGHYWIYKRFVGDANGFRDASTERIYEEAKEV